MAFESGNTDRRSVEIFESMGEWFVRVLAGNGGDADVKSFAVEEFAESYSAGQAARLGVAITRARASEAVG